MIWQFKNGSIEKVSGIFVLGLDVRIYTAWDRSLGKLVAYER